MRKDVFIGSSEESKPIATKISEDLEKHDIKARPWWNEFEPGSFTLEQLLELSADVDAAVFVFGNDDNTCYRKVQVSKSRDNVILEWGIFVARLGPKKCIILCENGVERPTDLAGLTFVGDSEISKVAQHLEKEFNSKSISATGRALIVSDIRLGEIQMREKLPDDWLLRRFYLGCDGAKAWISANSDPSYKHNVGEWGLRNCILSQLEALGPHFRTFVSLGPGDGLLDDIICMKLKHDEPCMLYIPVDISDGLLMRTYGLLESKISIPVGILADFESGFNFVESNVKKHGKGPFLYGLLGGTFGNFDTNEYTFLSGLINSMSDKDAFLFDVALYKDESEASNKPPDVYNIKGGRRKFYALGACRALGKKYSEIEANFEKYIHTKLVPHGPSAIPNTYVVVFSVEDGNLNIPFAYVRRYTLDSLTFWLENTFHIEVEATKFPGGEAFDRALLTLKKKT